ncbi:LuxR C-terminal-related transcriptional regulator [Pseudomonas fluorescens]|uniref:Putative LuxR-family regulatory protein n=1 Tax=Pseudomonas fluorescens (strain Pf0-1) TaxID=205922 RepID=Q3K711_PSEPF|nr:LuxR C-terminal-related transcriptional regulator [Pseudomonas fluorescens]ABA76443.1 putative LuxR-family regulatory protein [Pseudomonas fluorescens Pf0-1]MBY9024371.1 LuxR C-terminal-related transcriptional regulator [Pseudomonas fluorescens]MBY9032979.1 LuxR C-terminal-related transcriptional regulator [Pseudomonas fluorescens]MBY9035712.1 LuxR C-terminal-related transcriptional regulator [Pseudomonas fluorescens]MBY9042574.1 LuxR C-terminal-related transcriptional regulator [Pseudomona
MTDLSPLPGPASVAVAALDGRFFRPPLPDGYVMRPRLCERLQAGLGGRLLLVSAPAGFGKSSLAVEFCQSLPANWHSLWLGLSPRDNDPGRFLERLLEGLQDYFPQLGSRALGLLKMRQRHQPFAFEEWLDGLLDELAQHLEPCSPLLLVLDDYHLAQGPVLDRCLQFFLNHLPDGLLVMVTSRQRPDWHLARLRLSRQLLELHEQDLRLTHDEASALLDRHRSSLRGEALENLIQRSEGWVAGLRFWLLAESEAGGDSVLPQALNGGEGLIRDYLLEEVIDCLPAEVQAFLYDTAPQERFCSELCDAVREAHDSAEILRFLLAHQVFLVPLDEHGHWYRYHHLFSDLLRSRPITGAIVPAATLHLRACRWFNAQGLLDEAVEQALRAGHLDVAANLVQNLSEEQLLAEQNVGMLLRWKMDLPDSLLISTPRLIVLYSWALGLACQLDAAEELASHLSRFLPAPSATAQKSMLAQWLALKGIIARGRGHRQQTIEYCSEALESLPAKRYGQRLMCLSTLSNLAIADGDLWRARGLNRESLELAQRVGNPLFEALAHYDRARVLQARGEIMRALDEVRQGLDRLRGLSAQRLYAVRARLTLYEGFLLAMRLQPQVARARLQAGLSEARACRDISVLIGHCVIARLEGSSGDFAKAFAELAEAERLMHIWDVPPIYYLAMITLVKCELWLSQGRIDLAEAWLARLGQTYTGERAAAPPEFHPQLPLHVELQQALLDVIQGQPMLAEGRLNVLLENGQQTGRQLLSVMALTQKVVLLLAGGRESEARKALGQALEAAAGGVLQPFEILLKEHSEWLRGQLQLNAATAFCQQLLEHFPQASVRSQAESVTTEQLSSRELAVLRLIAQGCSNQEISDQLFISLHTVKTHASHINSKLGVERRTQAVARAKELGVLS